MLKHSTNHIERNMANVIEEHFPYYEKLWYVFLIDGIGEDNHWKDGPLERIGIELDEWEVYKIICYGEFIY